MIILRQALLILLLALLPAALIGFIQIAPKDGSPGIPATAMALAEGEVDLATALSWSRVLWVDARAPELFEQEHIPGAVPLSEERWEEDLVALFDEWKPEAKTVVYCDSATCDTSKQIAARLRREVGLENVYFLHGGWDAWQDRPQPEP